MQILEEAEQNIKNLWQPPFGKPDDPANEIPEELLEAVDQASNGIRQFYQKLDINMPDMLDTIILAAIAPVVASRDRRIGNLKQSVIRYAGLRRCRKNCQRGRRSRLVRSHGV